MTLETWERRTEWPLTVLAVVFLGCYAWPILDPGLDSSLVSGLSILSLVIWASFGVDYIASIYLSGDRVTYVRRHLLDLVMLPPDGGPSTRGPHRCCLRPRGIRTPQWPGRNGLLT